MRMLARIVLIGLGGVAVFAAVSWTTADRTPRVAPAPAPVAAAPAAAPAAPKSVSAGRSVTSKPAGTANTAAKLRWRDLSIAQQDALMPLVDEWGTLDGTRKQKWLDIANRFSAMKPDEQQRVHERMRDWIKLTPEERRMARENFARSKKLEPAELSAQWELYQQLPDEEKKKLAADAAKKKQLANLPSASQSTVKTIAPIKFGAPPALPNPAPAAPAGATPAAPAAPAPAPVAAAPSGTTAPAPLAPPAAPAAGPAITTSASGAISSPAPSNAK